MAAFVVLAAHGSSSITRTGARLNIFPGSALPSVFGAGAPFWIGYGFIPESADGLDAGVHEATGFELFVDGETVPLHTEVLCDGARVVRKFSVANFPDGLPTGWHILAGRWYEAGVLALTSDATVEFVER